MIIVRCIALLILSSFVVNGTATESLLRSSFDLQVPVQPTQVNIAGKPTLFYELHLTNFAQDALRLQRVQVLDADSNTEIMSFRDDALERRFSLIGLGGGQKEKRIVTPGMHAVVYLELEIEKREIARALKHRIEYDVVNARTTGSVEGARISVAIETGIVLDPPVRSGPWVAIYDPSWERGHRRVFYAIDGHARIPGRFAIDWMKLDSEGRLARGDSDQISNWYGYGADVLAVTDAVVAATRDDILESASISAHSKHALADPAGNYVALNLGNDRYAFYEHLKPGSIRVKPGQRVQRGESIASLGFTGDSTGPHLHFHVADANTPLGGDGMSYVLRSFKLLGSYDSLDQLGSKLWKPLNIGESQRNSEFPASNVVVIFDSESD